MDAVGRRRRWRTSGTGHEARMWRYARLYAVQKFARDVVEVAENLKRGLDSLPPRSDGEAEIIGKIRDGFDGIGRSFLATLERNGVSTEDPTGKLFDPNLHQAMAEQESAEHPPGTVLQAWTQGLDPERASSAPGDGRCGQGTDRGNRIRQERGFDAGACQGGICPKIWA